VDLSYNTNLRSIRICQLTLYRFPDHTPILHCPPRTSHWGRSNLSSQYSWIFPLLSVVSSTQISELVFTIWLSAERQLDLIDWVALSSLLGEPRFSNLKTFRVEVLGMGKGQEHVKGWLLERLVDWGPVETALEVRFLDK
jgi:hypothetical protein